MLRCPSHNDSTCSDRPCTWTISCSSGSRAVTGPCPSSPTSSPPIGIFGTPTPRTGASRPRPIPITPRWRSTPCRGGIRCNWGTPTQLRLPVNRWGGNQTSTYNWQNDTYNTGFDWYYENISNSTPASLPDSITTARAPPSVTPGSTPRAPIRKNWRSMQRNRALS